MLCIIQMKMEQNEMGGKVSRNASDNEELSSPWPCFIMSPWLVKKKCIQGDPGGTQCCFWRDSGDPHPYPLVYIKGGGFSAYSEDQKR